MREIKATDILRFEEKHKIKLPGDVGSETGVIGTIVNHPEYIYKSEYLKSRMFKERELGCIYHIVESLCNKGISSIDTFLISNEINSEKKYKEIFEEKENITSIEDFIESLRLVGRSTVEEYELLARKVISLAFKRESYIKLTEMAKSVLETKEEINELNYRLQTDLVRFANNYIVDTNVQKIGDKVDDIYSEIEEDRNGGFFGLPSKFKRLNEYFTYEKTELVVIGGRAKSGRVKMFYIVA